MAISLADVMKQSESAATSLLDQVMKAGVRPADLSSAASDTAEKATSASAAVSQPLIQKGFSDLFTELEQTMQASIQRLQLVQSKLSGQQGQK